MCCRSGGCTALCWGRFAEGAVGAALAEHFGGASLPANAALEALPKALAAAHERQGGAKVLFVVNEDERNFADWCQALEDDILELEIYLYIYMYV